MIESLMISLIRDYINIVMFRGDFLSIKNILSFEELFNHKLSTYSFYYD